MRTSKPQLSRQVLECAATLNLRRAGFTLIELLLVMTIMVVAIGVVAPSLGNFFRGRTLDSEARRLLALTHGGRSRAVSEGIPMRLWVNGPERSYGLDEQPGWDQTDPKAVQFSLDQDLNIEVMSGTTSNTIFQPNPVGPANALAVQTQESPTRRGLPEIRFLPDGTIAEGSPRALRLWDRDNNSVWLAQATNHLSYEIRNTFE